MCSARVIHVNNIDHMCITFHVPDEPLHEISEYPGTSARDKALLRSVCASKKKTADRALKY
jgi:hypothetical protein